MWDEVVGGGVLSGCPGRPLRPRPRPAPYGVRDEVDGTRSLGGLDHLVGTR
ncbi:hypothetical protein DVS28_a4812 [Euzebya pacifica]|uniref:Uncharacterized protein n=1 Tax=Euzebya pacifica TaxID=1608957 RepID=A0A346Y4S3_9ACTN|nr:hypothetical protein DVS28_a4812 [Euzebya pacifica]